MDSTTDIKAPGPVQLPDQEPTMVAGPRTGLLILLLIVGGLFLLGLYSLSQFQAIEDRYQDLGEMPLINFPEAETVEPASPAVDSDEPAAG